MRRLTPVAFKGWQLPLIVIALTVPIVAVTLIADAGAGLIAAALTVAVIVFLAARARFDEPIEVATASDQRHRILVVALAPVESPALVEALAEAAIAGERALGLGRTEALVLAPALNSRLAQWTSDLGEARRVAAQRLAVSLASLALAGVDARGQVGDSDTVQAVEDTLRTFAAHEVAFVIPSKWSGGEIGEVRRRLDRPVRELEISSRKA